MKKWLKYLLVISLIILPAFTLSACGKSSENTVKVGIVGSTDKQIWNPIAKDLKKKDINLQTVEFSDYNQPNQALKNNEVDINAFQHTLFLNNWNKGNKGNIVPVGKTYIAPLALYSHKIKNINQIKDGDKIALPNDPTNEGRALHLLESAGLIKVNPNKELPTTSDVTQNNKHLKLIPLDASQTPRALTDVTASVINNTFAIDAHLDINKSIYVEKVNKQSEPYINVIAANKNNRDNKKIQEVVKAYQSEENAKRIENTFHNAQIPAWNIKLK